MFSILRSMLVGSLPLLVLFLLLSARPVGAAAPIKINGPLVLNGDVFSNGLQFSPDSSRVLYLADQDTSSVNEIYSVASSGGTPVKLNGPLVASGDVFSSGLQFSPDGSRVLYLADQDTDGFNEIYLVPSGGGTPVKLNSPLGLANDVSSQQFSPDGSKVLYRADQDTDNIFEAYVRIVRDRANPGGGDWDTTATWDQSVLPDEVMQTFIDTPATVTATGNTAARTVNEVIVGGGTGTSTLSLESNAIITAINGVRVESGGVLRGTGDVLGDVTIVDGGEIRVSGGEKLLLGGASHSNAGRIRAIGTSVAPAEIEFDGEVTNDASTGLIAARNAILTFDGGLTNDGPVAVSFGTSDIFGDVTNSATGTIAVAGNSGVTFYDDVTNSGTLNVHSGSTAVFFGALAGNGNIGGGDVQALGDLLPGASPGLMAFGGDLTMGPLTNLEIELGGLLAGTEFDMLDIGGNATLGGTLDVSLLGGFTPTAGNSFDILIASGSINGAFTTVNLPSLSSGLAWNVNQGANLLSLAVGLAGDYNGDGTVDAADYTVWRDNEGAAAGTLPNDADGGVIGAAQYNSWVANFGAVASLSTSVPEPSGLALLACMAMQLTSRRKRV